MDTIKILNELREYYNLKRNIDFARFFEISEQNANAWYKRTSLDFESIYKHCPEINPDWLLSGGEGEMLRPVNQNIESDNNAQVGRDLTQHGATIDSVNKALDALREEQSHTASLIEIVKTITANPKPLLLDK